MQVGFEEYELGPGGSIAFDSSSPHRLWTVGDEPVHAVWVVIGREADPRTANASLPRAVATSTTQPAGASPSSVRSRPTPALLVRKRLSNSGAE